MSTTHCIRRDGALGFSMVELLVALAIGSLLIVGAVFVYTQSRSTYAVNETTARLQEQARYLLETVEPDIQLAGYYGYTNAAEDFRFDDGAGNVQYMVDMEQTDGENAVLPAIAHVCGPNFAVDLLAAVQGTNNDYLDAYPGAALETECEAEGGGYQAGTDTFTIRRASTATVAATDDRLQFYINRTRHSNQRLFFDGVAPGALTADLTEIRDLVVRSYYIAQDSAGQDGVPSLHVKRLNYLAPGAAPGDSAFEDEEIMSGVEDMQVQFGIDTGDYDGVAGIDVDEDGNGIPDSPNGIATRYVNPDSALLPAAQVVSVRIWFRIRAETPEVGFVDNGPYNYADVVDWVPGAGERNFRRIVVSKTINLRNSRTL